MKAFKSIKGLVYMSLLIAMEIILTRFLSIQTPIIRFGFGFLPIAVASIIFGAIPGAVVASAADILGMMIFPSGAYFPGFTLSAFLGGSIYGIVMHNKKATILRTVTAVAAITIIVDLFLNTCWLTIITQKAALVLFMPRLVKSLIMFPIQSSLIYSVWKMLEKTGCLYDTNMYSKKANVKYN